MYINMDIQAVLKEYDAMFRTASSEEINIFLKRHVQQAETEGNRAALLTLLNEQIGFYRDTNQKEKCISACCRLRELLGEMQLVGTVPYGKSLLNMANAFRVFHRFQEAAPLYQEIETVYLMKLPAEAYEFAALYNNWSLFYLDQGNQQASIQMLKRALSIVDRFEQATIEQAISRVNLACALLNLPKVDAPEDRLEQAECWLRDAIVRFVENGAEDYHYSAALSAMGDLQMRKGNYTEAAENYEKAVELVRMYLGENAKTDLLRANQERALAAARYTNSEEGVHR